MPITDLFTDDRQQARRISRRNFLKSVGIIAAVLSLPSDQLLAAFTASLAKTPKLPVIWLEFQDCTGDTESLLRAAERSDPAISGVTDPSIVDLLLDVISLDYHETLVAPAGAAAEKSLADTIAKYSGQYLTVVEGAIPTAANGAYCCVNGRSAMSFAQDVFAKTAGIITAGTCAAFGGLPAAAPNPTGAKGVAAAFPSYASKIVNLPGCPMNVVNFVATVVYYISYGKFPSLDSNRRPTFAYGSLVHRRCPRNNGKSKYAHGPWAATWGDSAHKSGGCLIKTGCRGPQTYANCSTVKWNSGTSWPVDSGHGCIGCTTPNFWDVNFPYYSKALPSPACGSCHDEDED